MAPTRHNRMIQLRAAAQADLERMERELHLLAIEAGKLACLTSELSPADPDSRRVVNEYWGLRRDIDRASRSDIFTTYSALLREAHNQQQSERSQWEEM